MKNRKEIIQSFADMEFIIPDYDGMTVYVSNIGTVSVNASTDCDSSVEIIGEESIVALFKTGTITDITPQTLVDYSLRQLKAAGY